MDQVILEIGLDRGPSEIQSDPSVKSSVIEVWTLTDDDWTALLTDEIGDRDVDIVTTRDVLARESEYFRALFGGFREAGSDRININWDTSTFLYLLQFIFRGHCIISSSNVASLLEAAIFFGVDSAIQAVELWARLPLLSRNLGEINDILQNLPYIWDMSNTLGHHSLTTFCPYFLAVNFVVAISLSSFLDLPCTLLSACVAHPQLTVHSEKQLCEALLKWYENQAEGSESGEQKTDKCMNMLSKVQKTLLPKDFLLRCLHQNSNLDVCRSVIRITDHLEYLDLSGCYEVTDRTLFTSSACAPLHRFENPEGNGPATILEPSLTRLCPPFYLTPVHKPSWQHSPSFENLKRLNLSQCLRIPQDSLIIWLGEACPNLLELTLINCPQITFSILEALATACPRVELIDISLDRASVTFYELPMPGNIGNSSRVNREAFALLQCTFSGLTQLSLRGPTEISDHELIALAHCAPSLLEIDLSMCTGLTDHGFRIFLSAYPCGFKSFKAKWTAFGPKSCIELAMAGDRARSPTKEPSEVLLSPQKESMSLANLDLAHCYGATEKGLATLLKSLSSITHLSLGETKLTDQALDMFSGTSLQQLDVRETQVSRRALTSIVKSNPDLKILDIRGCKRVCVNEHDLLVRAQSGDTSAMQDGIISVPLLFQELGRQHKLEDLKVGWGFDHFAQLAVQPALLSLKNFTVGIGGTISDASLQNIAEHCMTLKQLSLSFQTLTEDGLAGFLDKSNCLHTLEVQCCNVHLSSWRFNSLAAKSSNLSVLKLERVAPCIRDSDISVLSERCSRLSHLSLVGCKSLTEASLKIIAKNWCGLAHLKLEECNELTTRGADCLLQSCGALETLTLRHNGKGLAKEFIMEAIIHFPLLRHLSLDLCDSVANGFQSPDQVNGALNTLFLARCKLRRATLCASMATSHSCKQGMVRCHEDTVFILWNAAKLKACVTPKRL